MKKGSFGAFVNSFTIKKETIIQKKSIDVMKLKELGITASEADIHVLIHENPSIDVVLETYENGPNLTMTYSDNMVDIIAKRRGDQTFISFQSAPVRLLITVPNDIAEAWNIRTGSGDATMAKIKADSLYVTLGSGNLSLSEINVKKGNFKTASGNLVASDLKINELYFQTSSGKASLTKINCETITGSSSSGGITLMNLRGERFVAKASSGNITLGNIVIGEADIQTSSGKIEVDRFKSNKTSIKATSGNIKLSAIQGDDLKTQSSSGNIIIASKDTKMSAKIEVQVSSGRITNNLPIKMLKQSNDRLEGVIGEGRGLLKVRSNSGNVDIF